MSPAFPRFESFESRRLFAAQALNFTDAAETVVMWKDSAGYNRFGPVLGATYYFDANGTNPATSFATGKLFRFDANVTHFDVALWGGNDTFSVASSVTSVANFTLDAGSGDDDVSGWINVDTLSTGGGNDRLDGQGGDDVLTVTGIGNATLLGGGGNDTISGKPQYYYAIEAHGGPGSDTITGGSGEDTLYGDDGDDVLDGGSKQTHDTLYGGQGTDVLYGSYVSLLTLNTSGTKTLYGNSPAAGDDGRDDVYLETTLLDLQLES